VERTADNREVLRSNRSGPTMFFKSFLTHTYYFVFRILILVLKLQLFSCLPPDFRFPNCVWKHGALFAPELRFGIAGNRRFSGSCDVIATVRCPFHSLRSLKQTKSLSEKWLPAVTFTICNMQNRNGHSDIIDRL
jgi:hypothetical protein